MDTITTKHYDLNVWVLPSGDVLSVANVRDVPVDGIRKGGLDPWYLYSDRSELKRPWAVDRRKDIHLKPAGEMQIAVRTAEVPIGWTEKTSRSTVTAGLVNGVHLRAPKQPGDRTRYYFDLVSAMLAMCNDPSGTKVRPANSQGPVSPPHIGPNG